MVYNQDLSNELSSVNDGGDNTGIMDSFAYNDFLLSGTEEFTPRLSDAVKSTISHKTLTKEQLKSSLLP